MKALLLQILLLSMALLATACGRDNPLGTGDDPDLRAIGEDGRSVEGDVEQGAVEGDRGRSEPRDVQDSTGSSQGMRGPQHPRSPNFPDFPGTGMAGRPPFDGDPGMPVEGPGAGTAGVGGAEGVECFADGWCCFPDGTCCSPEGVCSGTAAGSATTTTPSGGVGAPASPMPEITDEPWSPPFELGEPGWQDSDEPLCTEEQGLVGGHSVWADSRGVFVMVEAADTPAGIFGANGMPVPFDPGFSPAGTCEGEHCPRQTIYMNDGSGWQPFFERDDPGYFFPGGTRLTGIDGGPLFTYGYSGRPSPTCGLATITSDGERVCEPVNGVDHVFVVNSELAYGVLEGNLVRYDGSAWGPLPEVVQTVNDMGRVWATPSDAFVASHRSGKVYHLADNTLSVEDTQTLSRFTAIWGFSETNVWTGTESGELYHYDGTAWSERPLEHDTTCPPYTHGIRGMWGADGVLYFYTAYQLGRVRDGEVDILAEWGCQGPGVEQLRITSIWGRGPEELFIAVIDESVPRQACGTTFVLHYDGTTFHRM